MQRTGLVIGATGLIGKHLVELLLNDDGYASAVVFARKRLPIDHPKLTQHVITFDDTASFAALITGDDLFCCLGTTIKTAGSQAAFGKIDHDYPLTFAEAGKKNGVQQYLIVSALSADPRSSVFYSRVKGEVEEGLKQVGFPSLKIFRPSMLLGERTEFRLGERLGQSLLRLLQPVLIGPWRRYRAIKASDVAQAMIAVAKREESGTKVFESDQIQKIAEMAAPTLRQSVT